MLGLRLKDAEQEKVEVPEEIDMLIRKRAEAKKNKQWKEADAIRDEIKSKGFLIEDTPEGVKVRKG